MPSLMRQCLQHVSGVYQRRRCHWQQVTHLHPRYTGRHDAEERPREKHHQRELISCGGDVVARPCPFGGTCLEDNSKEPPHRWGRTYSEQKRANAQRSYPALPAGNCVSADRNDCVSDKLSEQQRRALYRDLTVRSGAKPVTHEVHCGSNSVCCGHQQQYGERLCYRRLCCCEHRRTRRSKS